MIWKHEEQFADWKLLVADLAALRVNDTDFLCHLYQPTERKHEL